MRRLNFFPARMTIASSFFGRIIIKDSAHSNSLEVQGFPVWDLIPVLTDLETYFFFYGRKYYRISLQCKLLNSDRYKNTREM